MPVDSAAFLLLACWLVSAASKKDGPSRLPVTRRFEERYRAMFEGKCLKCGARYFGWALRNPKHQRCDKCGGKLQITDRDTGKVINPKPPRKNA